MLRPSNNSRLGRNHPYAAAATFLAIRTILASLALVSRAAVSLASAHFRLKSEFLDGIILTYYSDWYVRKIEAGLSVLGIWFREEFANPSKSQ